MGSFNVLHLHLSFCKLTSMLLLYSKLTLQKKFWTYFTPPKLLSSDVLILDWYCHHRTEIYIIWPRYVGPSNYEGVLLACIQNFFRIFFSWLKILSVFWVKLPCNDDHCLFNKKLNKSLSFKIKIFLRLDSNIQCYYKISPFWRNFDSFYFTFYLVKCTQIWATLEYISAR